MARAKNKEGITMVPYVTMKRQVTAGTLSQEVLDGMVEAGVVAPDPNKKDFGNADQCFVDAKRAVGVGNEILATEKSPHRLRLSIIKAKD